MRTVNSIKLFFGQNLTKRQFPTKRLAVVVVLLLILLAWSLPNLLAKGENMDAKRLPKPRLLPVEALTLNALSAYRTTRAYTGKVVARRTSDLGFERGGKLVDFAVDEGDRVLPNQPLATLDTLNLLTTKNQLQAQRAQALARLAEMRSGPRRETIDAAQAQVQEQRAELSLAKLQRKRRQHLMEKGVIAREEYDAANAETQAWQARLDAAQRRLDELQAGTRREQVRAQEALVAQFDANLAAIEIDLDKSVLKAPFAGKIASRTADEGTVVSAGQALLRLVEDTHLEMHVGVPPHVTADLRSGSTQTVRIGQLQYQAQVDRVLPELDTATRTVTAILSLSASREDTVLTVVPGQVARLQVEETIESSGYWLPLTALTKGERGLWSCFALVPDSQEPVPDGKEVNTSVFRTEHRLVEVLHTDNSRVFVRGLLQPGEQVVKTGMHRLVAGQRVQVMP